MPLRNLNSAPGAPHPFALFFAPNSFLQILQPADETPSPSKFTHRQHQLVAALSQWKVHRIVFHVHDAEKSWIAKVLRASSPKKNLPVQEHAHIIAVANIQLLYLVALGMNGGPRVAHFHPWLRLQAFGKVFLK